MSRWKLTRASKSEFTVTCSKIVNSFRIRLPPWSSTRSASNSSLKCSGAVTCSCCSGHALQSMLPSAVTHVTRPTPARDSIAFIVELRRRLPESSGPNIQFLYVAVITWSSLSIVPLLFDSCHGFKVLANHSCRSVCLYSCKKWFKLLINAPGASHKCRALNEVRSALTISSR